MLVEQQLMMHGYSSSINVNELDDEELMLRYMILQGILEKQNRESPQLGI